MSTPERRVAVVTGAGRGIGAATAHALAEVGYDVVLAARTREQVEREANILTAAGRRAKAVICDVTSEASVESLAREAATLGRVAVLVNNAGAAGSMSLARTTLDDWNRLLAVNATGAFLCTRAFLPGMVERKSGRVVNVASTAGLTGGKYLAAYSAAKHALVGLTRSAAAEVASDTTTAATSPAPMSLVCPAEARAAARASSRVRPVFAMIRFTVSTVISVSTNPGQTAFTVTPVPSTSAAADRVSPTSACFAAE